MSSIKVDVDLNNENTTSNEFRIRTNMFRGFIKGFFLEANKIYETLDKLDFYMNDCLRINFDKYMIQNMCVKINENMIYVPFNSESTYDSRLYNSFVGSLNIDTLEHSFLNLKFAVSLKKVNVYALNMNIYSQENGAGFLTYNYPMHNFIQDFCTHTLRPIEELLRQYVFRFEPVNIDASLNYVSQTLLRSIVDEDRIICPIRQTPIQSGERYMLCIGCQNCYNEYDIIQWFVRQSSQNMEQTCPTCRQLWSDYNVYIHSIF